MKTFDEIARHYGCDKSSAHHNYGPTYTQYFEPLRSKPITLLEIGFGGYEYPDRGGAGARTWSEYFMHPSSLVISTDIHKKILKPSDLFLFYQLSQTDATGFIKIFDNHGAPDIITDDGGHIVQEVLHTFKFLFPYLKPGGFYVVEDVESAYSDKWSGGNPNPNEGETTMNFFKRLTDQLNAEFFAAEYRNEYAGKIDSIHFHRNMVVIKKR